MALRKKACPRRDSAHDWLVRYGAITQTRDGLIVDEDALMLTQLMGRDIPGLAFLAAATTTAPVFQSPRLVRVTITTLQHLRTTTPTFTPPPSRVQTNPGQYITTRIPSPLAHRNMYCIVGVFFVIDVVLSPCTSQVASPSISCGFITCRGDQDTSSSSSRAHGPYLQTQGGDEERREPPICNKASVSTCWHFTFGVFFIIGRGFITSYFTGSVIFIISCDVITCRGDPGHIQLQVTCTWTLLADSLRR